MARKIILSLMVTFFISNYANAMEFELFNIDLPNSWTFEEENGSFRFISPENVCVFDVLVAPHFDVAYRELAISFYQSLSGANATNDDGGMTFNVKVEENIPSKARITLQGENFAVITASGQCLEFQDVLQSIKILDTSTTEQESEMVFSGTRAYPILEANPR